MNRIAVALFLFVTPTAAAAQASSDFCPGLKQLVASATETPSFRSMTADNNRSGAWIPSGMLYCGVSRSSSGAGDSYACQGNAGSEAQASSELENLHARISECLGVTGVTPALMDMKGEDERIYRVSPRVVVSANRRGGGATHIASFGVDVSP